MTKQKTNDESAEVAMMRRVALMMAAMTALILAACGSAPTTGGPGGPEPLTFPGVRLYQSSMTLGQYAVDVSADGTVNVQVQRGPGTIQRATGHLTPEQVDTLFKALKGWKKLPANYEGDWQNAYEITYDDYKVTVHDIVQQAPPQFVAAKKLLDDYGRQALQASTQAATQTTPASAPATRP